MIVALVDRTDHIPRRRGGGGQAFAINPLAVARYRERHSGARTKSDKIDAAALANILRTDMDAHRPLPADTELAQSVLAPRPAERRVGPHASPQQAAQPAA